MTDLIATHVYRFSSKAPLWQGCELLLHALKGGKKLEQLGMKDTPPTPDTHFVIQTITDNLQTAIKVIISEAEKHQRCEMLLHSFKNGIFNWTFIVSFCV